MDTQPEDQLPLPRVLQFPESFIFGTAVSAFQTEKPDHERHTDWDVLLQAHPTIIKPHEVGPDWYDLTKAKKDIDHVAELGMQSLRLSLEWARIEPTENNFNEHALNHYRELVNYGQQKKMEVVLTLNHFSLPLWIAQKGGWGNTGIREYFLRFCHQVIPTFADVNRWITINEPSIIIASGYLSSLFPPQKTNLFAAIHARRNLLDTHKAVYKLLKKELPQAEVGLACHIRWYRPENPRSFSENLYTSIVNYLGSLSYISDTKDYCDFIGCNFYTGYYLNLALKYLTRKMRKDAAGIPRTILFGETKKPGVYTSDMGWPIVPDFFLDLLRFLHKTYQKPLYITENGIADHKDTYRSFFVITHLSAIWKALREGAVIKGYEYWSAVDNLEWLYGYKKAFGLIEVNPLTEKREIRKSAYLYSDIVRTHAIDVEGLVRLYLPDEQQKKVHDFIKHIVTTGSETQQRFEYLETSP